MQDRELLRDYVTSGSEAAFADLVDRYVDFVYSTARRQVGNAQLAEEVAQVVFSLLARKAVGLVDLPSLAGWLYRATCFTAAKTLRTERRRRHHEQEAATMNQDNATDDEIWERLSPMLDDALKQLEEQDRLAVFLRFFQKKPMREVGETLGVSEAAAKMRVSRAVERLREFFSKRGVAVGASGLATVLSANAVQSAPIALSATISASAAIGSAALHQAGTVGLTKALAMTTIQKTLIAATVVAAVGTGVHQARRVSQLTGEIQSLKQRQAPLIDQSQQLRRQRDDTTRQLATMQQANEQLRRDTAELGKLRGEAARFRADAQELAQLKAAGLQKGIDPSEFALTSWLDRAKQLKRLPEKMPDKMIPELQLLSEDDWLQMCKVPLRHLGKDVNLDDNSSARLVFSHVRMKAKEKFANMLSKALRGYSDANSGQLPADMLQLLPYFESGVDETTLRRYEILRTGKMEDVPNEGVIMAEKTPVDSQYDTRLLLGKNWSRIDNNLEAYSGENPTPRESKPLEK